MYASFFGLKQEPFSIAPDPRYLFMSERHREALAHLLYGVGGGGGFVLLTGEIGAGKTTVCRCFLEQIPRRCNVAYIFNPKLTVEELLRSICDEFHIPHPASGPAAAPGSPALRATVKDYVDPLNQFLLKTHAVGQNNVLIIDEAQNLSADVLEQLRLLTNLETSERKLLQIILIGQPELRAMLARPELEQLGQRVIARYHLKALTEAETLQYIRHRLVVAGLTGGQPFERAAMQRIHQLARGVPRRINLLCDRALLGAYAHGRSTIDVGVIDQAASEVFEAAEAALKPARPAAGKGTLRPLRVAALAGAAGLLAGAALYGMVLPGRDDAGRGAAASAGVIAASAASGAVSPATPSASAAAAASAASAALAALAAPLNGAASGAVASAASAASAPPDTPFKSPLRDEATAWRELASNWQLDLGAESDPCLAAQRQQVQCFRGSASLAQLRELNRPAILALQGAGDGAPAYAQLTGLSAQGATLRVSGVSQTVALPTLARMWRGDYLTLWRMPPGYADKAGGAGAAADWLAARLHSVDGAAPPAEGNRAARAAALRERVSAFQIAQGLKPDGLAGPITLMQLNRATGVEEPRLSLDTAGQR